VKVAWQSRRFWELDDYVYGGIAWSDSPAEMLWYPSADIGKQQGVLVAAYATGFYDLSRADQFSALSFDERFSASRALVERLHPGHGKELSRPATVSWKQTRYSEGLCVTWSTGRGASYELLVRPEGRTYFAGEHLSYLEGWIEGAVRSAHKAIEDLHARVTATA
jgi:monoamine oxidase